MKIKVQERRGEMREEREEKFDIKEHQRGYLLSTASCLLVRLVLAMALNKLWF